MRGYAKVVPTFWTRGSGKALRGDAKAQVLALYLITCPASTMTGLYHLGLPTMAHETGLSADDVRAALARLAKADVAHYDEDAELVWVPAMIRFQVGDSLKASDKQTVGIKRELSLVEPHRFVDDFRRRYARAYHLDEGRGSPSRGENSDLESKPLRSPFEAHSEGLGRPLEGPSEALPAPFEAPSKALRTKQEQEQKQEQEGARTHVPTPARAHAREEAPPPSATATTTTAPRWPDENLRDEDVERAFVAELDKHRVFATLNLHEVAQALTKRFQIRSMHTGMKLEWALAAIGECAADSAGAGLAPHVLTKRLRAYLDRARKPQPLEPQDNGESLSKRIPDGMPELPPEQPVEAMQANASKAKELFRKLQAAPQEGAGRPFGRRGHLGIHPPTRPDPDPAAATTVH